jgi:Fe2+ or Zn2+ uptake regulation protein
MQHVIIAKTCNKVVDLDVTSLDSIRSRGFRLTPQRVAILTVLLDSEGHLSASEIFERAVSRIPGLTEATIYRTLDFLVSQSLALIAHIGSGRIVYESALHAHHHLICRKCGHSVAVSHANLQSLYDHLENTSGFRMDTSHITFFGLCPACQSPAQTAQ